MFCLAGTTSKEEIEANYKISRRIEAEERALDAATMVFTSTQQEVGAGKQHGGKQHSANSIATILILELRSV